MARHHFPLDGTNTLLPLMGREEPCAADNHHHGRGRGKPAPSGTPNVATRCPPTARAAPCGLAHAGSKGIRRRVVGRLCAQTLGELFHPAECMGAAGASLQVLLDLSTPYRV